MTTNSRIDETPKERLDHIAEYSPALQRKAPLPRLVVLLAILLALATLVLVAYGGGSAAMEIVRQYVQSLQDFSQGR